MNRVRLLNIMALGLVVLIVAVFAALMVPGMGKQSQVAESTPTSGTEEPSPTEQPPPMTAVTETQSPPINGEPVEIRWFVGLGAGSDATSIELEQAYVDTFNASQNHIKLILNVVDNYNAYEVLTNRIAAGNPPDIIGPMGISQRDRFKGEWLDLQPLIDANNYDLSDFDPTMIKFHRVEGEGQLGIPFSIYPSFIFVNKDLFDEAGLPYPPQEFGEPYVDWGGVEHEWNMDTLRELAMWLTIDANGNDATSPDFDPENIVQFGYMNQYTDMRGALTMFGAGNFIDNAGRAQMSDNWREGAQWIYDAMWKDHFWPTDAYVNSDLLGAGSPFQSGNLAMAQVHMWFAAPWALGEIEFLWDTAVMPSYNGTTTAKMHADTFGIMKTSQHPQEAFEVLTYMLSREHAPELLNLYGAMPARLSLQDNYFETYNETVFPDQDINWQVVIDSTSYADIPNHESWLPNYYESTAKYGEYWIRWSQEPDLDLNSEIDNLLIDLQLIFDAAN